jgi:mannose-1-phosphate guanylyltransferase
MVTIDDQPLIDIWFDAFNRAGVDEVLVNLHYLPDVVRRHVAARTGPPTVHLVFEPELLGSAGTLLANREWVRDEEFFLACNADNLTDFELSDLISTHQKGGAVATLAAFHSENPSAGGVLEVDESGRMTSFTEKPPQPISDLVNAGIYAFSPVVLDEIPQNSPLDIGYHLLPALVGKAQVVAVDGYFIDIGTPDAYRRARKEWPVRAQR